MRRIAHLIATPELASSGDFRFALEEIDVVRRIGAARGLDIVAEAWDSPTAGAGAEAIVVGPVWDYQDRVAVFMDRICALATKAPVFNPPELIRWNLRKTYLRELGDKGVPVPPTLWVDRPEPEVLTHAFDFFKTETIVVKPQIGAGGIGLVKLDRVDLRSTVQLPDAPVLIQPFLPSLPRDGELSFVFFDGTLAHALIKKPMAGDFRSQPEYGGTHSRLEPAASDSATAQRALAAIPGDGPPLYARVDLARLADGDLAVMEIELIEPQLYFDIAPESAELFVAAVVRRLADQP